LIKDYPLAWIKTYLNKLTGFSKDDPTPKLKWAMICVLHKMDSEELVKGLNRNTKPLNPDVTVLDDMFHFKMSTLQVEHLVPVCNILGQVASIADKDYIRDSIVAWLNYRVPNIDWKLYVEIRVENVSKKGYTNPLSDMEKAEIAMTEASFAPFKRNSTATIDPKKALAVWIAKEHAKLAAGHLDSMLHPGKLTGRPGNFYGVPLWSQDFFTPNEEEPDWKTHARTRARKHMSYMSELVTGEVELAAPFTRPVFGDYQTVRGIVMMARSSLPGKEMCCKFNQVDKFQNDPTGGCKITYACHYEEIEECRAWWYYWPIVIKQTWGFDWGFSYLSKEQGDTIKANTYFKPSTTPDALPPDDGTWCSRDDKERLQKALNVPMKRAEATKINVRTLFANEFLDDLGIPEAASVTTQNTAVTGASQPLAARAHTQVDDASTINTAMSFASQTNRAVVIQDIPRNVAQRSKRYAVADDDMSALSDVSKTNEAPENSARASKTGASTQTVNEGIADMRMEEVEEIPLGKPSLAEPLGDGKRFVYQEHRSLARYRPTIDDLTNYLGQLGEVHTTQAREELMHRRLERAMDAQDLATALATYGDKDHQLAYFEYLAYNLKHLMHKTGPIHRDADGTPVNWVEWTPALYRTFINVRLFRGADPGKYSPNYDPGTFFTNFLQYAEANDLHPYRMEAYLLMAYQLDWDEASITYRLKERQYYIPKIQTLLDKAISNPDKKISWRSLQRWIPTPLPNTTDLEAHDEVLATRSQLYANRTELRQVLYQLPRGYWKGRRGMDCRDTHLSIQQALTVMSFRYLESPREYQYLWNHLKLPDAKNDNYLPLIIQFSNWLDLNFTEPLNLAMREAVQNAPSPPPSPPPAPDPDSDSDSNHASRPRKRRASYKSPSTAASSKRTASDRE